MKSFTFTSMLLRQRVDQQLGIERGKREPRPIILALLRDKQRQVSARLRRSLSAQLTLAG